MIHELYKVDQIKTKFIDLNKFKEKPLNSPQPIKLFKAHFF